MKLSPTLTAVKGADASDIIAFAAKFKSAAFMFSVGFTKVQPEFGAYMLYSLWQEVGLVNKNFPARPHIVPAVNQNKQQITKAMLDFQLQFLYNTINVAAGTKSIDQGRQLEQAWLRVLNGPVRTRAVSLARSLGVWDLGFHARSIHGYAYPRDPATIKAEAQAAMLKHKAAKSKQ